MFRCVYKSAQGDALPLTREALCALADSNSSGRPMLFALSQPGVLSPEDAFAWTKGRCIFTDGQLVRATEENKLKRMRSQT